MKKVLLSLILVLVLGLTLVAPLAPFPASPALAAGDDPLVCLVDYGPGKAANLTPDPPYGYMHLGLFYLTVDGQSEDGWCIEPEEGIGLGCFNATLSNAPRESPWCEIAYIVTNNPPSTNNTAAAIQLAIWKYIEGGRGSVNCTDDADLENAALQMYDTALGKSVIGPGLDLTLERDGERTVVDGLASQKFTATITDSTCLEGIAIEFSTNNGSFSSSGTVTSKTVLTDANGQASVTLYWDASQSAFTFTLTAHTEGNWPVIIYPIEKIQETIISRHWELTKQITPAVGGDAKPVNKVAVFAPWIGLALLLIGGIIWFALRRRSA